MSYKSVEEYVRKKLSKAHYEKFVYATGKGKNIRPSFMKAVCQSIGRDFSPLVPAASSIEVMHCASLIHDDVVDGSDKRRRKQAFHKKYGTKSAVLFGDMFGAVAIDIFTSNYSKEMCSELVRTLNNMVKGQVMELEGINNMDDYANYVKMKTSSLFELCARVPMIYYSEKNKKILEFARAYGIAFQIKNDLSGKKEVGVLDFVNKKAAEGMLSQKIASLEKMKMQHLEDFIDFLRVQPSKN